MGEDPSRWHTTAGCTSYMSIDLKLAGSFLDPDPHFCLGMDGRSACSEIRPGCGTDAPFDRHAAGEQRLGSPVAITDPEAA